MYAFLTAVYYSLWDISDGHNCDILIHREFIEKDQNTKLLNFLSENSICRVLGPLGQEGVVGRRGRLVH